MDSVRRSINSLLGEGDALIVLLDLDDRDTSEGKRR